MFLRKFVGKKKDRGLSPFHSADQTRVSSDWAVPGSQLFMENCQQIYVIGEGKVGSSKGTIERGKLRTRMKIAIDHHSLMGVNGSETEE